MAGHKRNFSQIDDDNDNNNGQPATVSDSSHTSANSQQSLIFLPGTTPGHDATVPNPTGTQPAASNNGADDTGPASDPSSKSPSPVPPPAKRDRRASQGNTSKNAKAAKKNDGEMGGDNNEAGAVAKRPRKRRRKGDPEPDHTAAILEKRKKLKRVGQACNRCHLRRFKCDNNVGGCYQCLRSGYMCVMTNRTTGESTIRGGRDGEVVDFDQMQKDNVDLKKQKEQLGQEIEQLRAENSNLRNQLQYYQNLTSSIGATSGPSNIPVSLFPGHFLNPQTIQQPNPNLPNFQPFASNYNMNNNAFSGNMSINPPSNVPNPNLSFGNSLSNAVPFPQWAQPNLSHGFPVASAYPPNLYQVPLPFQTGPFQSINNNQGMGYRGMQPQNFQYPVLQVPATQYLPGSQSLGTQPSNTQNHNPPDQSLPSQSQYKQSRTANPQIKNSSGGGGLQDQGLQVPAAQNQPNQNRSMPFPPNQVPQSQNLTSLAAQFPGNQMQSTNTQNQGMGMGSLGSLNQGHQVPNTQQAHSTGTQSRGFQYPTIQPQNPNIYPGQDLPNTNLLYQSLQPSLFGDMQNQGMQYQHAPGFQPSGSHIPQTQYPDFPSQGMGNQGLGYMNTQPHIPPNPGPLQTWEAPANTDNSNDNENDNDEDGKKDSEFEEEFNWTPPPRAGGQYVFPNTSTNMNSEQPQQTNLGGNNTHNNQGAESVFPSTTTDTQTQGTTTRNEYFANTSNTNNNDGHSPVLSDSEIQRLLAELETVPKFTPNGRNNNAGQGINNNDGYDPSASYFPGFDPDDSGLL